MFMRGVHRGGLRDAVTERLGSNVRRGPRVEWGRVHRRRRRRDIGGISDRRARRRRPIRDGVGQRRCGRGEGGPRTPTGVSRAALKAAAELTMLASQLAPLATPAAVESTLHVMLRLAPLVMPNRMLGGPDVADILGAPTVVLEDVLVLVLVVVAALVTITPTTLTMLTIVITVLALIAVVATALVTI